MPEDLRDKPGKGGDTDASWQRCQRRGALISAVTPAEVVDISHGCRRYRFARPPTNFLLSLQLGPSFALLHSALHRFIDG